MTPPRAAPGTELLDSPDADPLRVATSLRNIARANRWFGGTWAALYAVDQVLGGAPPPSILLVDIGTGRGDIPRAARHHLGRRGIVVRTLGLERLLPAAQLARGGDLPVVVGCGSTLPIATGGVDVVLLSQVLHHFDPRTTVELIREADRVARVGVAISDLRRSRAARFLFRAGAALLRFDADTVADGLTSITRGYRHGNLREMCKAAGVRASIERRPGFRLVAWWRKQ